MVKFEELFQETEDGLKADRKKRVGGYILGRTLGEGSFAKVRLATHIATNEKVAVKVINKKLIAKRDYVRKNMRREAVMLQRLDHPNIVGLVEVMETENSFYLVTDLAEGGDFMKYLTDRNCLDEAETRKFMRDIVSSVDHMHRSGVLHRDLKIENLLLDGSLNMKIIDFGLSNYFDGENLLTTQCGSPAYAAPEIFGKQAYGPAVDIWSIGINMFAMLTGRLPFLVDPPTNLNKLHSLIMQGCKVPEYFSKSCQDLLTKMLDPSEKTRITMEQLMNHPWLNLGTMPLHPRGLKVKITNDDINPAAVFYMVNYLNVPESQVREGVINFKPNATTGTYFLLCQRLRKGYGLPDGVDFVTEEPTVDTGPQRTHRGRPPSAQHTNRQRDTSLTRGSRDSSVGRRNERESTFHSRTGYTPPEKIQRPMVSVKVPYGEGIVGNGYDQAPDSQVYSNEQYSSMQREKAARTISSAGSNRDVSIDTRLEHVYPLANATPQEEKENKKTSLPDLPKASGNTPRSRLKDIFKLSARLRKPKNKKGILKSQDKSQSMPDQLNQEVKPPAQLHDSLAIRNVRFQRNRDSHEDPSRKPELYQPRLAVLEPVSDNRDFFSPRNESRNQPHGREVKAAIHHASVHANDVIISNVGYYTIPEQNGHFPRNRPQYRSDSSLSTARNQPSPFVRKEAKRMSTNSSDLYRGYVPRRLDKAEGITGLGLVATPR